MGIDELLLRHQILALQVGAFWGRAHQRTPHGATHPRGKPLVHGQRLHERRVGLHVPGGHPLEGRGRVGELHHPVG